MVIMLLYCMGGIIMLEVKHITKYYGKNRAVDNLSFTVNDGEIFGLLGENGAGKTTTFRIIMGLIDASSGEVLLDGKKIDYNLTDEIGFVTEERSLLTKLTVLEQLTFYGVLKGLDERTIEKDIDKWLERFEISSYKNRKIKELSKRACAFLSLRPSPVWRQRCQHDSSGYPRRSCWARRRQVPP